MDKFHFKELDSSEKWPWAEETERSLTIWEILLTENVKNAARSITSVKRNT